MPRRLRTRTAAWTSLTLCLALAGCQGWFTREPTRPLPRSATVRIWTSEGSITVHDAQVLADSLRGRVVASPADSFVAVPVGAIDSLQVRDLDAGATFLTAGAAGIGYLLYVGLRLSGMR